MPTLSANGSGDWTPVKGPFYLHLSGNFGTGTAQLEFQDDEGVTRQITGGDFTAAVDKIVDMGHNVNVRVTLSGATTPALIWFIKTTVP